MTSLSGMTAGAVHPSDRGVAGSSTERRIAPSCVGRGRAGTLALFCLRIGGVLGVFPIAETPSCRVGHICLLRAGAVVRRPDSFTRSVWCSDVSDATLGIRYDGNAAVGSGVGEARGDA